VTFWYAVTPSAGGLSSRVLGLARVEIVGNQIRIALWNVDQ
jgi:hypothetical protein